MHALFPHLDFFELFFRYIALVFNVNGRMLRDLYVVLGFAGGFSECLLRRYVDAIRYVTGIWMIHDDLERGYVNQSIVSSKSNVEALTVLLFLRIACSNHARVECSTFLCQRNLWAQKLVPLSSL